MIVFKIESDRTLICNTRCLEQNKKQNDNTNGDKQLEIS